MTSPTSLTNMLSPRSEGSARSSQSSASPCSKKVIAAFQGLKDELAACSVYPDKSFLQNATKTMCLANFQFSLDNINPKEQGVSRALTCFQKYLPKGATLETASCDELNTALDRLMHEYNRHSISTIAEEGSEDADSESPIESMVSPEMGRSPFDSRVSPVSVGAAAVISPTSVVTPRQPIDPCPSSPKLAKLRRLRSEVGFKANLPHPKGKDTLAMLLVNIANLPTFGEGKKKVALAIHALINEAKANILANPTRDPVDLYALGQYCTRYIPQVQRDQYLPENEDLSVEVCTTALTALLEDWDALIAEEASALAPAAAIETIPAVSADLSITGKEPFEKLLDGIQYLSLLGYEGEEMDTEIFDLITKTRNEILANPERAPVEIYALHAFCLKYLPQGKELKAETSIAALTSLLQDFDKLVAEEAASSAIS